MLLTEPTATALLLATFGLLMGVSVLFSRASERTGVPVLLLFLGVGMLAGQGGIGGVVFTDYAFAYRLGTVALALIIFDGGLNTSRAVLQRGLGPGALLATVGVVGTAAIVAAFAAVLGFPWPVAMLIGAVVSSTDAAAVFAVLRGSGLRLARRVGATLEVESGLNDPVAVLLTVALTQHLVAPASLDGLQLVLDMGREILIGGGLGIAIGAGGRFLLRRVRVPVSGLYPVLTLSLACLAFGLPTLLHGSGFLAVYAAALVLGQGPLPHHSSLLRVHDALAWLSQVAMFLVLGLLITPAVLAMVAWEGLVIGLLLAVVARPLVVTLCLAPLGFRTREVAYIGWVGLRGAVPIVLATVPVLANAPGAVPLFHLIFVVVVVNALLPGGTVRWVTRWLRLGADERPAPPAVLEISASTPLAGDVLSFAIDRGLAVCGALLAEVPLPEGAHVMLVMRGQELLPARGTTTLAPGDHAVVFTHAEDRPVVELLFGRPEGD